MEGSQRILGWQLQGQWERVWSGDQKAGRGRWVTISRIAVPLKVGTAMAAEMMGVCLLTGILDLFFHSCLCVPNINRRIDTIMKKTMMCLVFGCKAKNDLSRR